jgi:TPR repeat protein
MTLNHIVLTSVLLLSSSIPALCGSSDGDKQKTAAPNDKKKTATASSNIKGAAPAKKKNKVDGASHVVASETPAQQPNEHNKREPDNDLEEGEIRENSTVLKKKNKKVDSSEFLEEEIKKDIERWAHKVRKGDGSALKKLVQLENQTKSQRIKGIAQYTIGLYYFDKNKNRANSKDFDPNFESAFKWFQAGSECNNFCAKNMLGVVYLKRGDYKNAYRCFEEAATLGKYAPAQHNLGYMNHTGKGCSINLDLAKHWYTLAANQGNVDSKYELARMCLAFKDSAFELEAGCVWLEQVAAEKSDCEKALAAKDLLPDAYCSLGIHYSNGTGGCGRDHNRAIHWFSKSKTKRALFEHGSLLLEVGEEFEQTEEALKLLRQSEGLGYAGAKSVIQTCLDRLYAHGRVKFAMLTSPKDYQNAIEFYDRLSQLGHAPSRVKLANYHYDLGKLFFEVKDNLKALEHFELAAKLGKAEAEQLLPDVHFKLGEYYWKADNRKSFEHYQKAARCGHLDAEFRIAFIHTVGNDFIKMDLEKGYDILKALAAKDYQRAKAHLPRIQYLLAKQYYETGSTLRGLCRSVELLRPVAEQVTEARDLLPEVICALGDFHAEEEAGSEQALRSYSEAERLGCARAKEKVSVVKLALGKKCLQTLQFDRAIPLLKASVEAQLEGAPELLAKAHYEQGMRFFRVKSYKQAAELFQLAESHHQSAGSMYSQARYQMGLALLATHNKEKKPSLAQEALQCFEEASHYDNDDALFELAKLYATGMPDIPGDPLRAIETLKRIKNDNHQDGVALLSSLQLRRGKNLLTCKEPDFAQAISLLEAAALGGVREARDLLPRAYFEYAQAFSSGILKGIPRSYPNAIYWYTKAAELDHTESQFILGSRYFYGQDSVPVDLNLAIKWLGAAAANHQRSKELLGSAQHRLGKELLDQPSPTKKEYMKALKLLESSGKTDRITKALIETKRFELAKKIYKKAKKKDNLPNLSLAVDGLAKSVIDTNEAKEFLARAQLKLANKYIGNPETVQKARGLYKEAGNYGLAVAQYNYGVLVRDEHPQEAFAYFTRASSQGHLSALLALADSYAFGRGVEKDAVESLNCSIKLRHPSASHFIARFMTYNAAAPCETFEVLPLSDYAPVVSELKKPLGAGVHNLQNFITARIESALRFLVEMESSLDLVSIVGINAEVKEDLAKRKLPPIHTCTIDDVHYLTLNPERVQAVSAMLECISPLSAPMSILDCKTMSNTLLVNAQNLVGQKSEALDVSLLLNLGQVKTHGQLKSLFSSLLTGYDQALEQAQMVKTSIQRMISCDSDSILQTSEKVIIQLTQEKEWCSHALGLMDQVAGEVTSRIKNNVGSRNARFIEDDRNQPILETFKIPRRAGCKGIEEEKW